MKRISKSFILAIALIILLTVPVLAAYTSIITVTESADTSYTKLPIIANMNTTGLVTSGFISSTGLDTRVKSGSTELPHMLANDKLLFVSDIDASQSKQFTFTTGNTALTSYPIIVGDSGYITTDDNATLEPHDNFALTISLYLKDSGTYMVKEDALEFYYNASTEVLYAIIGDSNTPDIVLEADNIEQGEHIIKLSTSLGFTGDYEDIILTPTSDGDEHAPNRNGNTIPYASNDYTYVDTIDSNYIYDWNNHTYTALFTPTVTMSLGNIASVTVNIRAYGSDTVTGYLLPTIKTGGNKYYASPTGSYKPAGSYTPFNYSYTWLINPQTGSSWIESDISSLQFGINAIQATSFGFLVCDAVWITISAQYTNVPILELYMDGIVMDTDQLLSPIPDNNNPWLFYPNPYFNYVKLETSN